MNCWETWTFADLLAEPVRNGIYKKKEFHGRGQKMINMGELFSCDFISNQEMKRIELNDRELANYLVKDGDLLFARRSFVLEGSGKCSLVVQPPEDTTFESSMIRARPNPDWVNPRFYYYFFRSPQGSALISSITTRTAVSGIRGSELALLKVPKPPLPTQRKIAAVLSTYDALIENNTRRIEILEEMAQAIYREWFVEFRFPGHENAEMVESELGLIPQGWEVVKISDIVNLSRKGIIPSKFPEETFAHFSIPAFDSGRIPAFDSGNSIKSNKYLVTENCVLVSKLNPHIPRVWLPFLDTRHRAVASTEFLILQPKLPANGVFLFNLFRSTEFSSKFAVRALGTSHSHQRVGPTDFLNLSALIPTESLLNSFHKKVSSMVNICNILRLKNANLRQTRDLLLPKLVSGEIDVSALDVGQDAPPTG